MMFEIINKPTIMLANPSRFHPTTWDKSLQTHFTNILLVGILSPVSSILFEPYSFPLALSWNTLLHLSYCVQNCYFLATQTSPLFQSEKFFFLHAWSERFSPTLLLASGQKDSMLKGPNHVVWNDIQIWTSTIFPSKLPNFIFSLHYFTYFLLSLSL